MSTNCACFFFIFVFHPLNTLLAKINDSLLYSTDSDKEKTSDPLSLVVMKGHGSGGQRLTNNPLSSMAVEWCGSGDQHADHVQKILPFSLFFLPKKHHRTFSPFSPPKKHHRTMEEVTLRFIGRTVTQVSGHMLEGLPSTQQAAHSVLDDLAMPDNNVSKR